MPYLPQPDVSGDAILKSFGWAPADLLASAENLAKFQAAGGAFAGVPAIQTQPGDIRARGGETYLPVVPPPPSLPAGLSPAQLPGFDPYAGYKTAPGPYSAPPKPYVLPWDKNWGLTWEGASATGGRGPGAQPEPRWDYASMLTKKPTWYEPFISPMFTIPLGALLGPTLTALGYGAGAAGSGVALPSVGEGVGMAGAGAAAAAPSLGAILTGPLGRFAASMGFEAATRSIGKPDVPGPPGPPPISRTSTQSPRLTQALANLQATITRLRQARTSSAGGARQPTGMANLSQLLARRAVINRQLGRAA